MFAQPQVFPTIFRRLVTSSIVAVCLIWLTIPASAQDELAPLPSIERELEALITEADEELGNAYWGVHIRNLQTGETVFSKNAGRSFVPASNLKLYTTAAALHSLSPEFRFTTELYAKGTVVNDTLHGSLVVRGAGDPSIGGRFTGGDRTQTFRRWADSLKAQGIRHITGDIIGDDNIFDDEPLGRGWSWDDLTYWYAAPVSGLSFNDNCVDVYIRGSRPGAPATVSWRPYNTDYVTIQNDAVTISPDSSLEEGYERRMSTNEIRLYSSVPAGRVDSESLSVHNPTRYHVHILRETLAREGIRADGQPVDIDDHLDSLDYEADQELHRLTTYRSPPLKRLVRVINKKSQNLYADQLFKTLGVYRNSAPSDHDPGTFEAGVAAVESFLVEAGVDTARVKIIDGSGLSQHNLVTPEATVQVLSALWHHPNRRISNAFYESLPVGGVDGTLKFRFAGSSTRGNVRAKTGYLSNVRSLSGYVTTQDGTPLAFSVFCNNYTADTDRVDRIQNMMVSRLTELTSP